MESPEKVANQLVEEMFTNCHVAILAGSYVRGDFTSNCDLDIVIMDDSYQMSFRKSFYYKQYPVECFVHNRDTYKQFVKIDMDRARPSLLNMIREGLVLKDRDGYARQLKKEIDELFHHGPEKWSDQQINFKRYMLTDILDDFISCSNRNEGIFIASRLVEQLHEFILRLSNNWIGSGKWIYRALRNYDEVLANEIVDAAESYYQNNNKKTLIQLTEKTLNQFGGRLFDGFQLGEIIKK